MVSFDSRGVNLPSSKPILQIGNDFYEWIRDQIFQDFLFKLYLFYVLYKTESELSHSFPVALLFDRDKVGAVSDLYAFSNSTISPVLKSEVSTKQHSTLENIRAFGYHFYFASVILKVHKNQPTTMKMQ